MKRRTLRIVPHLLFILISLNVHSAFSAPSTNTQFQHLADEYLDTLYLPDNPTAAVGLGLHQYDAKLEDYSASGIKDRIARLKQFEQRVSAVNPTELDVATQGDRDLVLNDIRSDLLTLEVIRPWQKDPDYYSSGITTAAFVIIERPFAPVNDRLRSLISREKLMPAVLAEAKNNLKNPPKIYTQIAIEQLPGIISFFKNDVPLAFEKADDAALREEFAKSNAAVIAALESYQQWLEKDLLLHSHGDFRLGAATYHKKLQYDEMVDLPLQRLLEIGRADLKRNQQAYQQILKDLAKGGSVSVVKAENAADHPAADQLLQAFRSTFDGLISFIKRKNIISIPSDVRPIMEETPPFMRATTLASMDTPGPFEPRVKEAYFNVTLPEPSWDKAKVDDYLAVFNYPALKGTAIHETYPGHYVQFLWMHEVPSRVRKILGASSNAEGWAHYCEQMMLDEGYGQDGDTKQVKLLRLGQLQNALLRDARFVVGISMHTGAMTFNQAVDFFVKEGMQSKTTALIETKRGTSDPTYLYYTLGKLEILKLRADLQAKEGASFNLQKFHDDFMRQGFPPIKIVRRAMLQNNSPTL